jgi:serine/threonine protein kinase
MHAGVVLVDRYRLADVLGTGGFGKVWRAHDEATGTDVAIKLMPRTALVHAWQKGLLEAESRALAALTHPRIVRCVATHLTDSHVLLVLELVQGRNLADELGERCQAGRHYTLGELERHGEQLCEAVGFAHARGILHRDLKAANVMVTGDPAELKLLDFGIAKLLDGLASESTTTGRQLGTFTQLAPEVAMCAALDARVDIFGLGCLLFELASLRVPWVVGPDGHARRTLGGHILGLGGSQPAEIVHRICRAPRPSPLSYNPSLPAGVAEVLSRAMAVNPAHRYATASELLAAWRAALAGQVNVTLEAEVTPRRAPRATDPDLDTILPTEAFGAGDQVMSSVEIDVSSAAPVIDGSRTQPDALLDLLDTAEPVLGASAVAEAVAAEPLALVESTSQRIADALELVEQFADSTAVIARGARQAVTGGLVAPARPSGLAWSTSAPGLVSHGPVSMRVESPPPSRAQIHELHPRWVDFSSFVRSGFDVVPDMTGAPAVPAAEAPPQHVPWWALPSCALLVGPASYWGGPALGAAAAAVSLTSLGAAHHLAARSARRATDDLVRLRDALRADPQFGWLDEVPYEAGLVLRGRALDAPVRGFPQRVYLPRRQLRAGHYRVGLEWDLGQPVLDIDGSSHLPVLQLLAAMRKPTMRLESVLGWGYLKHISRRSPSLIELTGTTCRISVGVGRAATLEEAVDDVAMTMLGTHVVQAWMLDCLQAREALRVVG